jgi:hypothetical protein
MTFSGRKRAYVEREANGRAQRQRPTEVETIAELQPHRMCLPPEMRMDARAENNLGRLNLLGTLSDDQYEAGRRFAKIVMLYRAVVAPPAHPRSLDIGAAKGRGSIDDDECEARKISYNWAFEALGRTQMPDGSMSTGIANLAQRAVSAVAVHDQDCPTSVDYLRAGLDALARHFGIKSNIVKFSLSGLSRMDTRVVIY